MLLQVKATPGSKKSALKRWVGGVLYIAVTAPPEDGRANEALREFLAEVFDCKKNAVKLLKGNTAPLKTFELPITQAEFETHLAASLKA